MLLSRLCCHIYQAKVHLCMNFWVCFPFLLCTYARNTKGARSQLSAGLLCTSLTAIELLFKMLNNSAAHRWRLWDVPSIWSGFSKFCLAAVFIYSFFFCIYCIIMCSFCVFKKMRVSFYLRGGINFEVPASESLLQRRSGCAWTPFTSVWALKELRPSTLWCEFSKRHETTA